MTKGQLIEFAKESIQTANELMFNANINKSTSKKGEKIARLLGTNDYGCRTEVIQKLLEEVLDPEELRNAFVAGAKYARDTERAPAGAAARAEELYVKLNLTPKKKGITYFGGAAIVPIEGVTNGHNYPLDQMTFYWKGGTGWYLDGTALRQGNELPGENVRMATKEEIDATLEKLSEKDLKMVISAGLDDKGHTISGKGMEE